MGSRNNAQLVVPKPILINGLKHHLDCIRNFIDKYTTATVQEINYRLLPLGESQMDVYTGNMSPYEIAQEIIQKLQATGRFEKNAFINLLQEKQAGFATLQLSDGTAWILRLGELENRYVHIHPGRYATHTVRVKAGALKTAIATSVWIKKQAIKEVSLEVVNQVRKEILNASPVKAISTSEGTGKLIQLINSSY